MLVVSDNLQNIDFSGIVKTTQDAVNKLGVQIIEQIVGIADNVYNAQRDKHAIILRHTKTRKMVSAMGDINLKRRLYYDKAQSRYFFAVDELLDIEKHSRIESGLKSKLINDATLTSYGKASKLSSNSVSRQTVFNLVKNVRKQEVAPQVNGYKKIDELYIEADEDHIHLNNGKSAEVKLVYVHEGRKKVSKGRTELVNAKYFAAVSGGTDIWNDVADYVCFQYDVPRQSIRISGDGAQWIKCGLDAFPGAQYILDKFHVYKSVTDASSGNMKFRRQVLESIKNDDKDSVLKLYATKWLNESGLSQRKRMADSLFYLQNNFDEINLLSEYACSAEGHVSHVLSERMSSRPMGWSIAGADKMARLRAFYFNGGDFLSLTGRRESTKENNKRYNCFAMRKSSVDGSIPFGHFLAEDNFLNAIRKILIFKG